MKSMDYTSLCDEADEMLLNVALGRALYECILIFPQRNKLLTIG